MKVLHVINGELYSGAERVQDLLALGLGAHGFEVGFACLKSGLFPERRRSRDAPLHAVPMRGRADLGCGLAIARLVRRHGYRLIHTHTPRSALVGRIGALLARVPMVHHVHSPTSRDTESASRNRVNVLTERAALLGVKRLLPVSRSLSDQLLKAGYGADRIRLVPNGVPTPGPLPDRPPPGEPWIVGCVALFRPRKGLEVLVEALGQWRAAGRSVRLRAVGPFDSEDYRQAIERQARALGVHEAIDWVGFTSDVNAELLRMDTLVLPSLFGEGMPMVVLEAMAMGVPVIASRVEGTPEVIEHGRTGLLVPPGDATALARALDDLIAGVHDWRQLRGAAYERQSTRFSDRAMAAGVAAVYDELLPA